MRNPIVVALLLGAAVACSGGSSGDDACADPVEFADWPDPYSDVRCQFVWQCEDGQSGMPDEAWMAQCKRSYESFIGAEEDVCYDGCLASEWLRRSESRLGSCSDEIRNTLDDIMSFCPGGVPRE